MSKFIYKARSKFGILTSGIYEAENSKEVTAYLEGLGYIPISINLEDAAFFDVRGMFRKVEKVSMEELIVFAQQLSSVMSAGIPLLEGLDAIYEQIKSGLFREVIYKIKIDIEKGDSLSEALARYSNIFSPLFINMVRAGEKAGILAEVLNDVAEILDRELDMQKKIKAALRYPGYVLGTLGVGFLIVITFVIPRFAAVFGSFNTQLPMPTKILIGINYVLVNYWYLILFILFMLWFGFKKAIESPEGKMEWDRLVLALPIFGALFSRIMISRFCRMLAAMLKAGITIVDALSTNTKIINNKVISQTIENIQDEIVKGESFSTAIKGAGIFPPMVVRMVTIGEKAGNLEIMLNHVADYYDREISYTTANLTSLIEPILILFLASMVLLLALGVFLPMWSIFNIYK